MYIYTFRVPGVIENGTRQVHRLHLPSYPYIQEFRPSPLQLANILLQAPKLPTMTNAAVETAVVEEKLIASREALQPASQQTPQVSSARCDLTCTMLRLA